MRATALVVGLRLEPWPRPPRISAGRGSSLRVPNRTPSPVTWAPQHRAREFGGMYEGSTRRGCALLAQGHRAKGGAIIQLRRFGYPQRPDCPSRKEGRPMRLLSE